MSPEFHGGEHRESTSELPMSPVPVGAQGLIPLYIP